MECFGHKISCHTICGAPLHSYPSFVYTICDKEELYVYVLGSLATLGISVLITQYGTLVVLVENVPSDIVVLRF